MSIGMSKEKFYDSIAEEFDSIMNMYDTNRRLGVIFDDFWGKEDLRGKTLLDGGCGTGWFTKKASERGALTTSVDISEKLVAVTKKKNPQAQVICGSILELPFGNDSFDYVMSSEVIEHTPDPYQATKELIRVLKPGGKLCITVPNRSFWFFSVKLANFLRIRKYKGLENWVHYRQFKKFLLSQKIEIIEYKGIHLFPFVINCLNEFLFRLDKIFEKKLGCVMVNIAVYGVKRG